MNQIYKNLSPIIKPQSSTKKDDLIRQILQTQAKIHQYQQLQLEINEVNRHINSALTSSPSSNIKDKKGKSQNTKKNTHKKVKIYQLEKKYAKIRNEYDDKQSKMLRIRDYYFDLDDKLKQKAQMIEDEKSNGDNLKKLEHQIEEQNGIITLKLQEQSQKLLQSNKRKQLLTFERKKLRDQIRNLKMFKMNSSNADIQQYEVSASNSQFQDQINDKMQQQQLHELGSNKSNKYLTQRSISSFVKPSFNINQHRRQSTDLSLLLQKQSQRIQTLMNKMDIVQQKNQKTSSQFYNIRKQIAANEILVKHHKITTVISQAKLIQYQRIIEKTKSNINQNNLKFEEINRQLNKFDGQRGYIRGKLGIRIEEQRLVKGVNLLLEEDLQRLKKKLSCLILLKRILKEKYQ